MRTYQLAFMLEAAGDFEIVESFEADNDEAAIQWADENEARMEEEYCNTEWYILNEHGENICA